MSQDPLSPYYDKHYRDEYLDSLYGSFMSNPFNFDWQEKDNAFKGNNPFLKQSFEDLDYGEILRTEQDKEYGTEAGIYNRDEAKKDNKFVFRGDDGSKKIYGQDYTSGRTFGQNLKANAPYIGYTTLGLLGTFAKNKALQREQQYNAKRYQRMDNYLPSSYDPYSYNPTSYQVGGEQDLWNYIPDWNNDIPDNADSNNVLDQNQAETITNENEFMFQQILMDMFKDEDRVNTYGMDNYQVRESNSNPVNIDGNVLQRGKYARDYYMSKGLSKEDASAIVGNFMHESGMNTGAQGDKMNGQYTSFGLPQFHNERRDRFFSYAKAKGLNPEDIDVQLDYVLEEPGENHHIQNMAGVQGLENKTAYFTTKWERPLKPMLDQRINYARQIFNQ